MNSKVIQQYQIELFGTEIDLSNTSQNRPKHDTYIKDHKSKLKTQPEKLLHVSEVTGCCFILSFQGLEDSKDLSTVSFQRLLDTFAVTLHKGFRVGSLRHEHEKCEYITQEP